MEEVKTEETTTVKSNPKIKPEEITLGTIGKIIIPIELKKQIDYLHKKVGSFEWSGVLVYKHESGNIEELNNLVFKAIGFYLMDIGSGTLTEFHYTDKIIDVYDNIPEAMECSIGLCHTHHSMGAFHSGTDMAELETNAGVYNYYLSLVVDTRETYKCKIAFPAKVKSNNNTEYSIKNTNGTTIELEDSEEKEFIAHLLGDLDVEIESTPDTIPQWFKDRYAEVKKEKDEASKVRYTPGTAIRTFHDFEENRYSNTGAYQRNLWDDVPDIPFSGSPISKEPTTTDKLILFQNAILYADDSIALDIRKGIDTLKGLNPVEFEMYLSILDVNIGILHDNIYGVNEVLLLPHHLKAVTTRLALFTSAKRSKKEDNLDKLIEFLEEYALTN